MSDSETILQLLKNVEWRLRANRLLYESTLALSIVLILLITLQLWDRFAPFNQLTLMTADIVSALLFAGFVVWRFPKRGTFEETAASIDARARLHNGITTALWFINNPRPSAWVEEQLRRTAAHARTLESDRIYRMVLPPSLYAAAGLMVVFIGLSFGSSAALAVVAGDPVCTTSRERSQEPESLRAGIYAGLEEIARDLRRFEQTRRLADAIAKGELDLAADEMRTLTRSPVTGTPLPAEDVAQSFRRASTTARPGLETLARDLEELAKSIDKEDAIAFQEAGEVTARELERIEAELLAREAGDIRENDRAVEAPPGSNPSQTALAGQTPTAPSDSDGIGGSSRGQVEGPRIGAPTTLEVELQQEVLNANGQGVGETASEAAEASERERSVLDYRNVESELSPAQKDVLNRQKIPAEYRGLIKRYFEAIHK